MPREMRGGQVDTHPRDRCKRTSPRLPRSNSATLTRGDAARSSGIASVVGGRQGILSQLIQHLHLKRIKLKSQRGGLYTSSGHGKTHALLRGPQTLLAYSSSLDCYADTALMQRGGVCVFNLGGGE